MKLVIQSSAIRAAMLDSERDEGDEVDRPLSRAELHARAVAQANRPSNEVRFSQSCNLMTTTDEGHSSSACLLQAMKNAAIAAAVILSSSSDPKKAAMIPGLQ